MQAIRRLSLGLAGVLAGCGSTAPFHPAAPSVVRASPLERSYVLLPSAGDDDTLLGRVVVAVPANGQSLAEVLRPNECADRLAPKVEGPLTSTFEDAKALGARGATRGALTKFGLEQDAQTATHFYYKLDITGRITQADTPAYRVCCKEKGTCGYGYISALLHGQALYATAAESTAWGSVDLPSATEESLKAQIKTKRNSYGYVAAQVAVADDTEAKAVGLLGDPAATEVEATEHELPEEARVGFEAQSVRVVAVAGPSGEYAYAFADGRGPITENEFVRRFQALTGSEELSEAKSNRNPQWLTYSLIASAAGIVMMGVGAYVGLATPTTTQTFSSIPAESAEPNCNYSTLSFVTGTGWQLQCNNRINPGLGEGLAIAGGVVLGSGLAGLTYALLRYDGSNRDHSLSRSDAELYAAKYNRALRRGLTKPNNGPSLLSQPSDSPRAVIAPMLSPGFAGLVGRF
jgi:hypothetical protein